MKAKLTLAGAAWLSLSACPPVRAAPHRYDHVVIVIEENRTGSQIIGDNANAPYINSLAGGGVSVGRMFAIQHPSQPNYLQLFSGSDQGVKNDSLPKKFSTTPTDAYPFTTPNLGAELIAAGFTFGSYSEQLEAAGAADRADYDPHSGDDPGIYYRRKHNPSANWVGKETPLRANQLPAGVNMAFTEFPPDFTLLPTVSLVVPNQMHDMHDGSRQTGDAWLRTNLDAYAVWARTHNSLLIITWDEDDYNATNQIPTVFSGAGLRSGAVIEGTWTLHNILRTLEDMYGVSAHAGSAALVRPIAGAFSDDPAVTVLSLRQDLNGYASAQDTMISRSSPAANQAATQNLFVDKDTGAEPAGDQAGQALVRFDNLFGSAVNQIPANASIHSAKLVINTPSNSGESDYNSDNSVQLHRMIRDWTDSATWNSLTDGVSANDTEAAGAVSFSLVPSVDGAPCIFDVTADLELFQTGTAVNQGWLLQASGTGSPDKWTFKSSENLPDAGLRPLLEVVYSTPSPSTPYSTWAGASGLTGANALPAADPDHDGAVNLVEFSFNLDPLVPDSRPARPDGGSGLPFAQMVSGPGGAVLEITFLRRRAPGATGLTYTAQFSPGLGNWSGGLAPAVTPIDPGWERVTVRDSAASVQDRRYARLQLTLTP